MAAIITIERIKLYNSYTGDIDAILRINDKKYKEIFDGLDDAWSAITSKIQDIELISKGLVSQEYMDKTLKELKEICDEESFTALTSKIKFYKNFQLVAEILEEIKSKITPDTDTIWTGFASADDFLKDLNHDIENIRLCNFETLKKVNIEFAATCTYQELSMANYWSDEYLKMASRFDKIYMTIMAQKNTSAHNKPWWKFW